MHNDTVDELNDNGVGDSLLPDAVFAVIEPGDEPVKHLPHHLGCVKRSTENSTVDDALLRTALSQVNELSGDLRVSATSHLRDHARALGINDAEVAALIGESRDAPNYAEQIEKTSSYAEAEELLVSLVEAEADLDLITLAQDKARELASVDREELTDSFQGEIQDIKEGDDGLWHFVARVAQADKVNANRRLYPADEFAKNLPRVNRLAKAGRFNGRDGHASMFGSDKVSEICVRYDAVMLQGGDLVMEGVLVPTQAGQDIATLWEHHVQTEWSIVGYGNAEYVEPGDGQKEGYYRITDYILYGCDPVQHGAANTRTMKVTKPKKDEVEVEDVLEEAVESTIVVEEATVEPPGEELHMSEEIKTEETVEKTEETVMQEATLAPAIDVEGIKADIKADTEKAAKEIVAEAMKAGREQAKLESAKDAAIAKLAESDEFVAKTVALHLANCETVEAVADTVATITPQIQALKKPKFVETVGSFIHKDKERARFMWDGSMKPIDRPETVEGVKNALLEGLEDNGREDPSNKRWTMQKILENYEQSRENYRYLYNMTRQGFAESATTTTALGTTIPMVLPIIRQLLPMLIPYNIASVQPIDRPEARVYFYDPQYKTGTNAATADGSNLDDSSVFSSGWADHTEADTKSQISFSYTYSTVTAAEKAVYWDYTSAVMQDMQAYYNMDIEASMMSAAVDYLALEINAKFIETLAAGAGLSGTFKAGMPSTGFQNLNDWLTWGLSQALNRASADISKKMGQSAGWIITGPTQATLFEASNSYSKLPAGAVNEFGSGLRQTGTWQNLFDVYVFDWAETLTSLKNKMLIGYRPRDWNRSAAVFCPYVPLYISPVDATASTNTIAHSASSRNAMKVLQANGLYAMTISGDAGEAVTYTD